jgi:hypothetical protein
LRAKAKLARIEDEHEFHGWLTAGRLLEGFSTEQLLAYADRGEIPASLNVPERSKYAGMSRKELRSLWRKSRFRIRRFAEEYAKRT